MQPADIYLIDEPSAYLDSEQRIVASKVIKRFILHAKKTAFVVEHDFIMATYLADRVIVYEGRPSIDCIANCPQSLLTGMNLFLSVSVAINVIALSLPRCAQVTSIDIFVCLFKLCSILISHLGVTPLTIAQESTNWSQRRIGNKKLLGLTITWMIDIVVMVCFILYSVFRVFVLSV